MQGFLIHTHKTQVVADVAGFDVVCAVVQRYGDEKVEIDRALVP